jgi:hypothetical protein
MHHSKTPSANGKILKPVFVTVNSPTLATEATLVPDNFDTPKSSAMEQGLRTRFKGTRGSTKSVAALY